MPTHDLRLVAGHADHTVVLYAGRVVESGPTATVVGHPRHPFTRALVAATPRAGGSLPTPLPGDSPDPRHPDEGCAFAPRCAHALPACRKAVPDLVDGVACPVVG
jgi:oligopeptide/dipeptide ABC transporter ATP-binding protein